VSHSRTRIRRISGNTLKAIALVLLLCCGAIFGTDALANGKLSVIGVIGFIVAACVFWLGDKVNPN